MHFLLPHLAGTPDRTAVEVGAERISRAEFDRAARAHAACMRSAGVRAGERVAVWATAEIPTLAAIVGNALAGIPTVPLNPALGERELAHVLADASPRVVLAAHPADFASRTPAAMRIEVDGPTIAPEAPAPDAPLLVLYTSGTTGAPKGAVLTHDNAATNLDALADAWGLSPDDTVVHALPLFHVHGLVIGLFGSLRAGTPLRLLSKFSPETVCAAVGRGGTVLYAVPTMYHRLAEHCVAQGPDARRLACARLLVSGSAALGPRDGETLAQLTGQRVVERYGLTETLINCAARHDGPRTPGTVGPPLPGVDLRLVDDHRQPLAGGEDVIGEIAVRGPNVFAGYLGRPDATAAAQDADGFFYTGDIGSMTETGEVRIVGRRATDLIKTGGFKVGAGEIEAALLEHAAVAEAAVLGVPDEDLGERIVAFVVLRAGASTDPARLADHVAQALAPHKRPRHVELVDALPRNAMGKVMKRSLRARS